MDQKSLQESYFVIRHSRNFNCLDIYTVNIKKLLLLETPEQNAGYKEIFSLNQEVTTKESTLNSLGNLSRDS